MVIVRIEKELGIFDILRLPRGPFSFPIPFLPSFPTLLHAWRHKNKFQRSVISQDDFTQDKPLHHARAVSLFASTMNLLHCRHSHQSGGRRVMAACCKRFKAVPVIFPLTAWLCADGI